MLSVTKGTFVTVPALKGGVHQVTVEEMVGKTFIQHDWWGQEHPVKVVAAEPETIYATQCGNGEVFYVGENHTFFCRRVETPRWFRLPVAEMKADEVVFVNLPQRKIAAADGLLDLYDLDDKGPYLEPIQATDMYGLMRKIAFCGVTALRRKAELRIDLDRSRPSCFVNKLLSGSYVYDLEKSLGGMIASGIVRPAGPVNDAWFEKTQKTGTIFEGFSVFNNVPLLPARKMERKLPVFHIIPAHEELPVEITWLCS